MSNFELAKVNYVFADFKKQLEDAKVLNEQTVFDYEDNKGNKDARSHIYKLRQTVSAVDKVRKAEKAESLEYGRAIDSTAKEISEELRSMISVHETPIKAIEDREKQRKQLIENNIQSIKDSVELLFFTSDQARNKYKEREARIAQEATAKAEREAAEKIKQAERDKEAVEQKAKEDKDRAEQQRIAAASKAEQDQKDAVEKAQREAKEKANAEQKRIADARAKAEREEKDAADKEAERQANRAHQGRINKDIMAEFIKLGCDNKLGKKIVTSIAKKEISNIQINY